MNRIFATIVGLAIASSAVQAQQATADLQALDAALPGRLINDPTRLDWDVFGPGATSKAIRKSAAPGGGALQISTARAADTLYEAGANAPLTAGIKPGQRVTVAFFARAITSDAADGKGVIGVRFQQNSAPYPGFGDARLSIGADWQLHEVTALSDRDIAAGLAVVGFQLSGARQTIEIGQTIVVEGAASIQTSAEAKAAALPAPLLGKGSLINDPAGSNWGFHGTGITHKTVAATAVPGGSAVQFSIASVGTNPHDSGVTVPLDAAIAEGDVLIVGVLARTTSAETPDGLGRLGVRVQHNAGDYPGFGQQMLSVGPNWKLFQIRTGANIAIPKGEAAIALHLAAARQVIEIGRVYVLREPTP